MFDAVLYYFKNGKQWPQDTNVDYYSYLLLNLFPNASGVSWSGQNSLKEQIIEMLFESFLQNAWELRNIGQYLEHDLVVDQTATKKIE